MGNAVCERKVHSKGLTLICNGEVKHSPFTEKVNCANQTKGNVCVAKISPHNKAKGLVASTLCKIERALSILWGQW